MYSERFLSIASCITRASLAKKLPECYHAQSSHNLPLTKAFPCLQFGYWLQEGGLPTLLSTISACRFTQVAGCQHFLYTSACIRMAVQDSIKQAMSVYCGAQAAAAS
jgi:hypothetical protein